MGGVKGEEGDLPTIVSARVVGAFLFTMDQSTSRHMSLRIQDVLLCC